jgi:serralysin
MNLPFHQENEMKALLAAVAAMSLPLAAQAAPPTTQFTITQIVAQSGGTFDNNPYDYDILLNAVVAAGLDGALNDPTVSLTVFAPNDLAFIRLAQDLGYQGSDEEGTWNFLVDQLTILGGGNPIPVLTDVLLYHVAPDALRINQIVGGGRFGTTIQTLQGGTFTWFRGELVDNAPAVANPKLTGPLQIRANNGIIHTIDRVLLPVALP